MVVPAFIVLMTSNSEVSVRSKLRSSSPATAGDGQSIRSSGTRRIQSWRSWHSLVSFPASFAFFARLSLDKSYGLIPLPIHITIDNDAQKNPLRIGFLSLSNTAITLTLLCFVLLYYSHKSWLIFKASNNLTNFWLIYLMLQILINLNFNLYFGFE